MSLRRTRFYRFYWLVVSVDLERYSIGHQSLGAVLALPADAACDP
jgi:hypothetical protein